MKFVPLEISGAASLIASATLQHRAELLRFLFYLITFTPPLPDIAIDPVPPQHGSTGAGATMLC